MNRVLPWSEHYPPWRKDLITRVVCWFSCGAASAVATKLAITEHKDRPVVIAYCDTGAEHHDNKRFLAECEKWFDHKITILKSKKYDSVWDVFEKTRYLAGVNGARCTVEMKKLVREEFQDAQGDLQIFGMDSSEANRALRLRDGISEIVTDFPLINRSMSKPICLGIIQQAGIELPEMYKLGFRNNNCIGCVKGQAGYWNRIRKHFPAVFERMSAMEQDLDVALCKTYAGDGERKRVFLKDLPLDAGKLEPLEISCSLFCGSIEGEGT